MNEIIRYTIDAMLVIILGIVTKNLIPYIKQVLEEKANAYVKNWVQTAVAAAEQTITGSKMGEARKAWVIKLLAGLGIVADDAVNAMIEAAVKTLNDAGTVIAAQVDEIKTEG
ncbi:phage holin, LLH family [Papillibacter cinnamivorans]|uniref:Bacteriophage holin of superfamily 6 (Holin_LLH) n=1 Tax=Papillibacter cinnamivorans DSM 12816 TaxID=1122930 RepID=A0A1W1YTK1_9FIRM|nr:phage holin, LLH family [Papillibacter cinnamivorans]SMC39474.1 Bacteriophage holin of superfamily 6 (Holin_LLH) [Papillibacter cinnamivorans DSM 12816]